MSSIKVATIPGIGRGVIATRDINEGDIVFSEEPYVLVPNVNRNHTSACLCCAVQFPTPSHNTISPVACRDKDSEDHSNSIICPNDGLVEVCSPRSCPFQCGDFYCSNKCQLKYTDHHGSTGECTAFRESKKGKSMLNLDDYNQLRTIAAIAMRCKSEGFEELLNEQESTGNKQITDGVELVCSSMVGGTMVDMSHPPTDFSMIALQTTNYSQFQEEDLDSFRDVFHVYCELAGNNSNDSNDDNSECEERQSEYTEEDLETALYTDCQTDIDMMSTLPIISEFMFLKLCCAFQCNGFSIYNEFEKESASGIYGYSSMFNHCCIANIKKIITNRTLSMIALKDIKEGEQVFLSYVGALDDSESMPYNLRQWKLEKQYFFRCGCYRCQDGI